MLMELVDLKPLELRYHPVATAGLARQLAATFCSQVGSRRGTASVVGEGVMVWDMSSVHSLERSSNGTPRRWRKRPAGSPTT